MALLVACNSSEEGSEEEGNEEGTEETTDGDEEGTGDDDADMDMMAGGDEATMINALCACDQELEGDMEAQTACIDEIFTSYDMSGFDASKLADAIVASPCNEEDVTTEEALEMAEFLIGMGDM